MNQKVIKTGNSLAVTIPSPFVKLAGLRPGDLVKVKAQPEKGKITYFFSPVKQLPLSETFFKPRPKK